MSNNIQDQIAAALTEATSSADLRAFIRRAVISYWHPAAVVADTSPGAPLGRFLIGILGQPATQDGQMLGWRSA